MDFALSEEQTLIRDTAAQFTAEHSASAAVRAAMASDMGYDPQLWRTITEQLGWAAMSIPESYGGLGLGWVELAVVQEQAGRSLLCSPFFATVGLAATALLEVGAEEQRKHWLGLIAGGELTAALAWDDSALSVRRDGDSATLTGALRGVVDGHSADLLALLADGELMLIDARQQPAGLRRRRLPTIDQTRAQAELAFEDLPVPEQNRAPCPPQARARILQLARVALAAEQAGGANRSLELAVAYALERRQFGRPIGSFQAIKHKCADMMLRAESALSAAYYAACIADELRAGGPLGGELAQAAAVAGSYCGEAFFRCAADNIQIHGGVGFTWEYDAHLYFKRAGASQRLLGSVSEHLESIASTLLDDSPQEASA